MIYHYEIEGSSIIAKAIGDHIKIIVRVNDLDLDENPERNEVMVNSVAQMFRQYIKDFKNNLKDILIESYKIIGHCEKTGNHYVIPEDMIKSTKLFDRVEFKTDFTEGYIMRIDCDDNQYWNIKPISKIKLPNYQYADFMAFFPDLEDNDKFVSRLCDIGSTIYDSYKKIANATIMAIDEITNNL